MSKKGAHQIDGYFDYVVPPLEGFWWQGAASAKPNLNAATDMPPTEGRGRFLGDGVIGIDYAHKEDFKWISVIRLPDFVTKDDFEWAVREATVKKKQDFSKVEFFTYDEGLCVQCMHIGSYDNEPATVDAMHRFIERKGYVLYYTNQCPFNAKYVPVLEETAKKHGIDFKGVRLSNREEAQNVPTPVTTYALFHDGEYVTNEQMNDKKFLKLVNG